MCGNYGISDRPVPVMVLPIQKLAAEEVQTMAIPPGVSGDVERGSIGLGVNNRGDFSALRAPERHSFPPAVNSGFLRLRMFWAPRNPGCDLRLRAQGVRSQQLACSLALPAICKTVSRINHGQRHIIR